MKEKLKQIGRFILYIIWTNLVYGLILYFVCIWLARYSLLYAYLGNLVLIIIGLAIDEYILRFLQSRKLIKELKNEKDFEKNYRAVQLMMDNFVSFKTALYVFYLIILVVSQIIVFNPELVPIGEDLGNFLYITEYSVLLLIALDMLSRQFSKDRARIGKISEKLEKELAKDKD